MSPETKDEVLCRIAELERCLNEGLIDRALTREVRDRISMLRRVMKRSDEGISSSIIRSHKAICKVKQMGEKEAYGHDPAIYYTLGVAGEAGEMANALVRVLRHGPTKEKILEAIKSELPDVIIYSYVLAYVLDIDLTKLVNEKVDIVIERANAGYYGGKIKKRVSPTKGRRTSTPKKAPRKRLS